MRAFRGTRRGARQRKSRMSLVEFLFNLFANIAGEIVFAALAVIAGIVAFHYRGLASQLWSGRKTTSQDGKSTAHEANGEIYITEKNKAVRNLTHDPALDIHPVWSPDKRWLAFQSNRGGGDWNVWVADVGSGKLAQITRIVGNERVIGWDTVGNLYIDLGGSQLVVKSTALEAKLK